MSEHDNQKPKPFDPARFRLSGASGTGSVVRKALTYIPVRKPTKQAYVRTCPDPNYRLECGLLTLEGEDQPYIVLPDIAHVVEQEVKAYQLRLAIDRQGNVFLWPVPLPPADGAENSWNQSHRQIADRAEAAWIRMVSNREIGAYEVLEASGEIPDPKWPEEALADILELAFRSSNTIEAIDHPALKKLRGEL